MCPAMVKRRDKSRQKCFAHAHDRHSDSLCLATCSSPCRHISDTLKCFQSTAPGQGQGQGSAKDCHCQSQCVCNFIRRMFRYTQKAPRQHLSEEWGAVKKLFVRQKPDVGCQFPKVLKTLVECVLDLRFLSNCVLDVLRHQPLFHEMLHEAIHPIYSTLVLEEPSGSTISSVKHRPMTQTASRLGVGATYL